MVVEEPSLSTKLTADHPLVPIPYTVNPGPGLAVIPESQLDLRSDEEIIMQLKSYQAPTASEKNVWAFWDTGFDRMAPWTQRNVINWVRRLGPSWTVRVLDHVEGSPVHISKFVDASFLPEAFNNHTMTGPHVGPHSGDMVRLPLLYLYGGVWMDVGMMLFRNLDDVCWKTIEDPTSPYEMAGLIIEINPGAPNMLNGFIAVKRQNGFIKRWHDIYSELWKGATESKGLHRHALLAHLPLIYAPSNHLNVPEALKISHEDFTDYLCHFQCFERLRRLVDPSDGFDGRQFHREKIFLMPAMTETWKFQLLTAWNGNKQFEMLSMKMDDSESHQSTELYQQAKAFVLDLLANTSTMKLSHGPPGAMDSFLADLWDDPKNHDKDIEPGTFAAYLRYGSVHFDQTRTIVPVKIEDNEEEIFQVGVIQAYQSS